MIARHNLRTVFFFVTSLLLLSAFAILVAEKVPTTSSNNNINISNVASSMSLGFFSIFTNNTRILLSTLAFRASADDATKTIAYVTDCSLKTDAADFVITLIALGFGFCVVFPTYICVYLNSDVKSEEALSFAKKLSVFCAVVTSLFSLGLMLPLIIISIALTKNNNGIQTTQIDWPWAILVLSFLLITLVFVPWSIYRAKLIDNVRLDFPEVDEEQGAKSMVSIEGNTKNEASNEPTQGEDDNAVNQNSEQVQNDQQQTQIKKTSDRRNVYVEAASITFYKTRSGIGKLLLLLVCILAIFSSSTVASYSWFSVDPQSSSLSSTSISIHSALFGSCNAVYVNNLSSAISTTNSTVSSIRENIFADVYRGLNGTNLVFAIFLVLGAALQWTWCMLPLALVGCGFSCAVVGMGVDEMKKWNENGNGIAKVELNWLFWLQVGTIVVWFLTAVGTIVIQLCVRDVGATNDEDE